MNAPAITARICAVNDAARDYAICMAHDEDIREGMLASLGFELAKRALGVPRARKFGPTLVVGTKASLCLVVDERAIFVVVQLVTGSVAVISDERRAS